MQPKLEKAGLAWAHFLVMRRTHATLMKPLGVDRSSCRTNADVNQNVYTQSPVENRLVAVNQLEKSLVGM